MKCHYCSIPQDDVCSLKENTMSFELTLSLPPHHAQSDTLMVYSSRSRTIITVDREAEYCECHLASEASLPSRLNPITLGAHVQ